MKYAFVFSAFVLLGNAAYAQQVVPLQMPEHSAPIPLAEAVQPQEQQAIAPLTDNAQLDASIHFLQKHWARINYQVKDEDEQERQMESLAAKAAQITAMYPTYAEPKIWQAIIMSTQAGIKGGLGALSLVKKAKALLEEAEHINPQALNGSIYTSLGSLYYKVPGWPVGFGDDDKALAYLEQARALNPDGIDPNYFYGDYLIKKGRYAEAISALEHAMKAPPRPGREDADSGRRNEIRDAIQKAKSHL